MKRHATPPATWDGVPGLFPGTLHELAERLNLTPQGLWNLRTLVHARPPHHLLKRLARLLARGTADGTPPPDQQTLTRLWNEAKERADAS